MLVDLNTRGVVLMVSGMLLMMVSISWTLVRWCAPGGRIAFEGVAAFIVSCSLFILGVLCVLRVRQGGRMLEDCEKGQKDILESDANEKKLSERALTEEVLVRSVNSDIPPPYSERRSASAIEAPPAYEVFAPETRKLLAAAAEAS